MNESTGLLQPLLGQLVPWLYVNSGVWTAVGLLGNALFSMRFVIQWLHSEKRKEVHVPPAFWHLSFWGSLVTLAYSFHLDKLPVILATIFLPPLYFRNLMLLYRTPPVGSH